MLALNERVLSLIVLLAFCTQVWAQKTDKLEIGKIEVLKSAVLKEERQIYLYSPAEARTNLPVILVFDAESLFQPTVAALTFLTSSLHTPKMPEAIVVGIPNKTNTRDRDMPIPHDYGKKIGEEAFYDFLKKELLPFIKSRFKTNGHIISIGHSQGGLFVSYLLAKDQPSFPWALALDAPMTITQNLNELKKAVLRNFQNAPTTRYVSVETTYGWRDEWNSNAAENPSVKQIKLPAETHESMPFKGIWAGLNSLFHDFSPPKIDLNLTELRKFYETLSSKYGYVYEIPNRVIMASISRKMREGSKTEALEMINYVESKYGSSNNLAEMKNRVNQIPDHATRVTDSLLQLSLPSAEQLKPYLGTWKGDLVVPGGQNLGLILEVVMENGKPKVYQHAPEVIAKKQEMVIVHINKKGNLVFGRKNRGAGWVVTTSFIDANGELSGEEYMMGMIIPPDIPEEHKKRIEASTKIPNTFRLKRE